MFGASPIGNAVFAAGRAAAARQAAPKTTANRPPAAQKPVTPGSAPPSGGAPSASPAQPAQVSPYDATYQEQLAALQHQYENSLANDQAAYEGTKNTVAQRQGALDRQLPLALSATRAKAASEGLLQSGVLAGRAGGVEAKYAEQRNALIAQLQAAGGKQALGDLGARSTLESKTAAEGTAAIERARKEDERQGVNEPQPATSTPAVQPVPQVARQSAQRPNSVPIRQAAAKRAVGPIQRMKNKARF